MADCASLLDEELSSFVFNYLTENSGSQVRGGPLRIHRTSGSAARAASQRVAGRGARCARLMQAFRRLVSSIYPPPLCTGRPVSRTACVRACLCLHVCVCARGGLLWSWRLAFTCFLEEMSSATGQFAGLKANKTRRCRLLEAESGRRIAASSGIIWYAEWRCGNFWRNLEGSFNLAAWHVVRLGTHGRSMRIMIILWDYGIDPAGILRKAHRFKYSFIYFFYIDGFLFLRLVWCVFFYLFGERV